MAALSALVLLHKYRDYRELWSEIKLVQTFAVTRNTAGYFNNINSFILRKKCLTVSHIYYGDVQLSTSELQPLLPYLEQRDSTLMHV